VKITKEFLKKNKHCIFVFGDNLAHKGDKGGAALRECGNVFGFVTKKFPSGDPRAFFTSSEYEPIYKMEIARLRLDATMHPESTYLISKVGSNMANRFHIWETIIEPSMKKDLKDLLNVKFLW
jgi:hypothetical protein